ncbi:MAG TPA: ATP-grasp domain-containing protein [Patescibacteria group bacterium]|nr:ATP-grasp domain-containing protein [Patescibacteria group bacterium]
MTVVNHKGGVGEIGSVFNHYTADGCIGYAPPEIFNHGMDDAAPSPDSFVNRDSPECDNEEELARILGLFLYPGRVLGTTNPEDIIQLNPALRENWEWIIGHYDRIGLPHTKNVIWDDSFSVKERFPDHGLSTFFFGKQAHRVEPNPDRLRIVEIMNKKNEFIKTARRLGIPVPETICFRSKREVRDCRDFSFPVCLKVSESVSGLGVVRCNTPEELEQELSKLSSGLAFQIQEVVDGDFISVQYWATNNSLKRITATEQILNGSIHEGNSGPTLHHPWEVTDRMAYYLYQKGIKEHFGFDLVAQKLPGGKLQYKVIECNPRFTGAAYPYYIAWKLGVLYWRGISVKTGFSRLDDLDLRNLEFNPRTGRGVAIVNWGCIKDNKLGIVVMGNNRKDLSYYDRKLQEVL